MKIIDVQRCAVTLAIATLLVLSPALAGAQGSRFPGFSTETRNKHRGPVEITFTKWVTTFPQMAGVTGGDVPGVFVGEVLQRQVTQRLADECYAPPTTPPTPPITCGRIIRIEAMYEVRAGNRSFTALIRGGSSGDTGAAVLDGVILYGWRTGSRVHVEFETMLAPSPTAPGCPGAPAGNNCFHGTIHIERAPED
jgi:hypothetical protein